MKTIFRSTAMVGFILLVGCSGLRSSVKDATQASPTPNASSIAPPVKVILADGSSLTMEYSTIANLQLQTVLIAGKNELGPTIPDFLAAAGVKDFSQVTFSGLYNRTLTFTRDQLADDIILALREHPHAVNLESPNIPEAQWVLHVFQVEIR